MASKKISIKDLSKKIRMPEQTINDWMMKYESHFIRPLRSGFLSKSDSEIVAIGVLLGLTYHGAYNERMIARRNVAIERAERARELKLKNKI